MNRDFIPYTEALALKELGFDEPCFGLYAPPSKTVFLHHYGLLRAKEQVLAPLYQQAFRWFREKHNLNAEIQAPDGSNGKWNPTIHKIKGFGNHYDNDAFETYEEAELDCLRKLIEIVNQNKEDE